MAPEVERKLAAILSADVVGYSRLMAEDEAATIRMLTDYREEIAMRVRQHRGRVVDTPGDNLLAELPTALDGVFCAVETQGVLRALNARVPDERRMDFRIGVHMGDVAVEDERVYGDGVNIAARLERLAEPGGICISGTVRDQVEGKLDLSFEDLGEQSLRNIPKPVRAFRVRIEAGAAPSTRAPKAGRRAALALGGLLLLAVGALLLWNLDRGRPMTPEEPLGDEKFTVPGFSGRPAIAVLPFDNMSGDPDQEYFADGLADELITGLTMRGSFPVIARNSSFRYRGGSVDVKQVSRELGVRYVVEGSVRRANDRVRMSVQLIDATTGRHVWAETYDRDLREIFSLHDEVTEAIVGAVNPALMRFEAARAGRRKPENLDAYDHSMRGMWHLFKRTEADNAKARALFESAIEMDSEGAFPFFGLSTTHYVDVIFQWSDSPRRSIEEALRAAQRCAALDHTDHNCQTALGWAHSLAGRREEAMAAFETTIRLNPSSAGGHFALGLFLGVTGRPDDGIAHMEKAIRLSPQDVRMGFFLSGIATAQFAAGRYERAVEWAQRSLGRDPDYYGAYGTLAASHAHLGQMNAASRALQEMLRRNPEFSPDTTQRVFAIADRAFIENWLDGLRKAGLKE